MGVTYDLDRTSHSLMKEGHRMSPGRKYIQPQDCQFNIGAQLPVLSQSASPSEPKRWLNS